MAESEVTETVETHDEPTTATVDVHVETPESTEQPADTPEEHTTVVVESESENIPPAVAEFMAETREALTNLSRDNQETQSVAATAAATAESTAETLGEAVTQVEEVAAGVQAQIAGTQPTSTPEDDVSPHKPHVWFRPVKRGH